MTGGLHHVTALTGNAPANIAFYTKVLGLRLVKRTVNFDDPLSWHLYYGDELGRPGTLITFFVFPGLPRGRHGTSQATEVSFAIARAALAHWVGRLTEHRIAFEGPFDRSADRVLRFTDPEGLQLELVAVDDADARLDGSVPVASDAIRGLHGVTLWEETSDATRHVLTERLGFQSGASEGSRARFSVPGGRLGAVVDIRTIGEFWPGSPGAGTVHHIAFRTADDDSQAVISARLAAEGLDPTPRIDRVYFHSVYFREPGGVLFEVATDGPGFTVDEPANALGTALKLPPWLEARRASLEQNLPPLGPSSATPDDEER